MGALTLRLPEDEHNRLKVMARQRGTSVNRLIEEMTTLMLAQLDAESLFAIRAERGRGMTARGLALVEKAAETGNAWSAPDSAGVGERENKRHGSSH
jgi:hypothetical protein